MSDLQHMPWHLRWLVRIDRAIHLRPWLGLRWPEFAHLRWFNLSIGCFGLSLPYYLFRGYGLTFTPWNAFRRICIDGSAHAGFGLVQVARRHLIYTGYSKEADEPEAQWRMCVAFVWLVGGPS